MQSFDRRSILEFSMWGAGAALGQRAAAAAPGGTAGPYAPGADQYVIDDTSAVADTESGKVVGYIRGGIRTFKGIPYGEIRAPDGRWMRGAKVRPWSGKRSSRAAGLICPPTPGGNDATPDELVFRGSGSNLAHPGEDCLRLNVWTPGIDTRKRQVLFYCHGGGYNSGSSLMGSFYDATHLARYGDVVVVSMNHRLNALGFLDLTAYGARFADSANLGMLDVIDALKWVRTNIANFGGDPARVMIFGHSGGGSKVATLLGMPEAAGLFNRAVVQSPGPLPLATPTESAARTATFLKLVDVAPTNIDALYKLPVEALTRAAATISAASNVARERFDMIGTPADNVWRPVVDGRTLSHEPTRPRSASDVPLMIGTVLHEAYTGLGHPEYESWNENQSRSVVREFFGPSGDAIYDVYKAGFPKASPFEVSCAARAMGRMRGFCAKMAQHRSTFNAAPTYLYWVHWRSRNFDGKAMSHHEIEMPLVFLNSDTTPEFTGATEEARELSQKMADTWLTFARSGNPNNQALPTWDPVKPATTTSMVFDAQCRVDQSTDARAIDLFWNSRFS